MVITALHALKHEPAVISALPDRDIVYEHTRLGRTRVHAQRRNRQRTVTGGGALSDRGRIEGVRQFVDQSLDGRGALLLFFLQRMQYGGFDLWCDRDTQLDETRSGVAD